MIVCCEHKCDNRVQDTDSQDSSLHRITIALLCFQLLMREVGVAHFQQELNRGRLKSLQHRGSDAVKDATELFGE